MIFDRDDTEYIPDLGPAADPPVCGPCKRENGTLREMEPAESWQPGYVADVWRCPECGTEVMRGERDNETFL